MPWCGRCRKSYNPAASGGVCPVCGTHATAWPGGTFGLTALVLAGLGLVGGAVLLVSRGSRLSGSTEIPVAPEIEIAPTEFPAARASIRPPRGWQYDQRSPDSIAFKHLFNGGAVRFRLVKPATGRDAHLALVREIVPGAELDAREVPPWEGAEAIALKLPGHPQVGASWILPRGAEAVQVLFWGDASVLPDVPRFRDGLRFAGETK